QGTHGILGDEQVNADVRWGGRGEAGVWLTPSCDVGLEVGAFFLSDATQTLAAGDRTGHRILGRPFINARTTVPTSEVVSFPRTRAGVVLASADSSDVMGADALVRVPIFCEPCPDGAFRLDYLAGYRFLYLSEGLIIREEAATLSGTGAGTSSVLVD